MRFVRFLIKEVLLNGIVFIFVGTTILTIIYLISIGATFDSFLDTFKALGYFLLGKQNQRIGFSTGQIIFSGAKYTLPLALLSLLYIFLISVSVASISTTVSYLKLYYDVGVFKIFENSLNILISFFATIPLFLGFWLLYVLLGSNGFILPLISLCIAFLGGLLWDVINFLKTDMLNQIEQTHSIVYSTMGRKLGKFFPIPGSYSGFLFASSLPKYLPYLAGKVPSIIGSVTIAEIAFDFPGLGKNLIDALISNDSPLLIDSVFILLCITAIVSFLVKIILFFTFPRVYEKSI